MKIILKLKILELFNKKEIEDTVTEPIINIVKPVIVEEIQEKMFEALGFTKEEAYEKFGFLIDAFKYGTPPHAGAAPGFDRMVMLIADEPNIREVIAFPKNKKARDALMGAPSTVTEQQLKDIHIRVVEKE